MTNPDGLHVVQIEQLDPRLGRNVVHDHRSRAFVHQAKPETLATDVSKRRFRHRLYMPRPNPNQGFGWCTGADACTKMNAAGNRVRGVVLDEADAIRIYSRATQLDPWPGSYPPDDTGSSGLAACQASKEMGLIERYEWVFGGHDALLAALWERPVGLGTWWYENMFKTAPGSLLIGSGGRRAGGHEYTLFGWDPKLQAFDMFCWWGEWGGHGRARIHKDLVEELRADDGDAHVTFRAATR